MTVKGVTAAKGKTKKTTEKMSPVCKQAKLHSLRRSDPSAPKTLPSAYPTPACNPQGSHGQLPSTSVQDNLSPCSLCNSEEGNGSYPAAWHCGNQCPPKLWRQNSLSLDRKLKKKKLKAPMTEAAQ